MIAQSWNEQELELAATGLAETLAAGAVVWLSGDLGAGKTTFARALLRALGVQGEVGSPTYGLVHRHQGTEGSIFHVDCYRFGPEEEAGDLDWDAMARGRAIVIEWPERAGVWAPRPTHRVHLAHTDDPVRRLVEIR